MRPMFTIRLAWRNIWRQKRRTLITASAIAAAMLLSLFMRSMQEGSYARNLDNAARAYSGYLQLQQPEFSENQSIDKLLPGDARFLEKIHQIEGVTTSVPRIESFALGAAGDKSKGVVVMGVDPPSNGNRILPLSHERQWTANTLVVCHLQPRSASQAPQQD